MRTGVVAGLAAPRSAKSLAMSPDAATRQRLLIAVGTVVGLLVSGGYVALERMTRGRHLTAAELEQAVASVGRPLSRPPPEVLQGLEPVPVPGTPPDSYDVVVPLWTEAGPAGVGVEIRLVPTPWTTFDAEILGLQAVDVDAQAAPGASQPATRPERPSTPAGPPAGDPVRERWRPVLTEIVHRLVVGDYDGLARDGIVAGTDDPRDAGIGLWIEEYPATLVDLPPGAWAYSDHGPIEGAAGAWWVIVDLWTAEEGRSDLSMEATVWDDGRTITVKVHAVHVM